MNNTQTLKTGSKKPLITIKRSQLKQAKFTLVLLTTFGIFYLMFCLLCFWVGDVTSTTVKESYYQPGAHTLQDVVSPTAEFDFLNR